jgi:DNA-binding NtrC family response regulator
MESFKIFVVEDDPWYAEIIEYHLNLNPEYEVYKFTTGRECLANLYKKPSVITLDFSLPDMRGDQILKKIKETNPNIPIIIISGQDDITTAIELLKKGAYDYIVKDDDTKDRLWISLKNIKENLVLREENTQLKEEVIKKYEFNEIIKGNSDAIKGIFKIMAKTIDSNITVSITGETGTGKELVAKAIHYNSTRKKQALVSINVAAVPKDLLESELFGHEKGAFTGANTRRTGKFEAANKGTLFLDEIAEMDLNMQSKLLRVLQEREISRIGSNSNIKINIRLITATHKNLVEEVKKGNFRQDLYYRLIGIPIHLPTLRERSNDILLLAKFFSDNFCSENNKEKHSFSQYAQKKLLKHSFPGNIRELRSIVEMGVIMSDTTEIQADDITFSTLDLVSDFFQLETTLENYNVMIVKHLLDKHNNNAIKVAQILGIGKSTIYRMIKKHNIPYPNLTD